MSGIWLVEWKDKSNPRWRAATGRNVTFVTRRGCRDAANHENDYARKNGADREFGLKFRAAKYTRADTQETRR
jgi:hypothetical protein